MRQIFKMQNEIQPYAWGSYTAMAELLGHPAPSDKPQAELWMGAHPKAPSRIRIQQRWQPLNSLIQQNPGDILGTEVLDRFGKQLPYLFKVLAAGQPLSIQAHPDKNQARLGFERENKEGISLTAPHRNYKDRQHKPECICALTSFWALCGFRHLPDMMSLLGRIWPMQHSESLGILARSGGQNGLRGFFKYLMTMPPKVRLDLVSHAVDRARSMRSKDHVFEWIVRLNEHYPNDIGVLSPILLNLIHLKSGEAIFLPARLLHAYLEGMGIELMANSDNVLRGGLTPKHVDVPELLNVLDFRPFSPELLTPGETIHGENCYPSDAEEFRLSVVRITSSQPYQSRERCPSPEILLCTRGSGMILWQNGQKKMPFDRGESVFVPAVLDTYTLNGRATVYKAAVNLSDSIGGNLS